MKILMICDRRRYKKYIAKNFATIFRYYRKHSITHNIDVLYVHHNDKDDSQINYIKENAYNSDLIVLGVTEQATFAKHIPFIFNLNIPVCIMGDDFFNFDICVQCQHLCKCDALIQFDKNQKLAETYQLKFPEKYITNFKCRMISSNVFKNYNLPKKYDILIYGSRDYWIGFQNTLAERHYKEYYYLNTGVKIDKEFWFYPLRKRINDVVLKNIGKWNVKILDQANSKTSQIANEDLSKLINQSWLVLATSSRQDIAFFKYWEIAASYSCIIGNTPSDYKYPFENNIIEVDEFMSDEQIVEIIDNALANKNKLKEMYTRLGDIVHNEFSIEKNINHMDKVFSEIKTWYDSKS